jgi:hypothetical protein
MAEAGPMIYGLKMVVGYLVGTDRAERNFEVRSNDTFVVSYPRSGNTWTRFLIANLVYPQQEVSFTNIERLIPDTSSQSSRALKATPSPRIIKTHQYFDHRYPRVIYIVRDPRDVVLSYYDFQRKYRQVQDGYPLERYVDDFVFGRIGSRDWGTWGENVASWMATRGQADTFLLLRYEDMIAKPVQQLGRISAFLNVNADHDRLQSIVDRCSADRMRELEQQQSQDWVATKNRRKDIPFVRVATSGGWRTLLPVASLATIESAWGNVMTGVGYDISAGKEWPLRQISAE